MSMFWAGIFLAFIVLNSIYFYAVGKKTAYKDKIQKEITDEINHIIQAYEEEYQILREKMHQSETWVSGYCVGVNESLDALNEMRYLDTNEENKNQLYLDIIQLKSRQKR